MTSRLYISLCFALLTIDSQNLVQAQCPSDAECNSVCGVQGKGTCQPKKIGFGSFCSCDGCPNRSLEELTNPHLCTIDPICQLGCPSSNLTAGRTYWGHTCLQGLKLVCVCFCMPTTLQSVINTLTCPFRSVQPQPN